MENKIQAYEYAPEGVCSQLIHIEINSLDEIENAYFVGGCSGNTQGVCALIKGMKCDEVITRLKGIKCGNKSTSCPDQLSIALEAIKMQSAK